MAELLQLQRQHFVHLTELILCRQIFKGGRDEALRDFERCLDLNTCRGTGIKNRNGAAGERGKQADRANRNQELGADRTIVPKPLQNLLHSPHRSTAEY